MRRDSDSRNRIQDKRGRNVPNLSFALDNVHEAAYLIDEQAHFQYVNETACRILGYTREELLAMGVADVDPAFSKSRWQDYWRYVQAKRYLTFERCHRDRNGRIFPVEIKTNFFEYGDDNYVFCLARDVSEHKQAQEALDRREQEYRTLLDNIPDLIVRYDKDLRRIYVNPAWEKAIGYSAREVIGVPITEVAWTVSPETTKYLRKLHCAFKTGEPQKVEFSLTNALGVRLFMACTIVPEYDRSGNIESMLAIGYDETARKLVEQKNQDHLHFLDSMDRVSRAMQGANDLEQMMSAVLDAVLVIFKCDRARLSYPCTPGTASIRLVMQRTRPEYPGVHAVGAELPTNPDDVIPLRALLASSVPVGFGPGLEQPMPLLAEQAGARSQLSMVIYPKGDKPYIFGLHQCSHLRTWAPEERRIFQQIGRRISDCLTSLLAYRNLQDSERYLRTLLENLPACICRFDKDGRILYASPAVSKVFGIPSKKLLGKVLSEVNGTAAGERQQSLTLESLIAQAFQQGVANSTEGEWMTVQGSRSFDIRHVPEKDETGKVIRVMGIAHDITERKQSEALNISRLHLIQFAHTHTLFEFLGETLNVAEKSTGSCIGFVVSVDEDQKMLTFQNWSTRAKTMACTARDVALHYPIGEAGVWAECVRTGKAVIHNDYASLPNRKGLPEGHVRIVRELIVPVLRNGKVRAVFGVGNKPADYSARDLEVASLIADMAWEIAERKLAEESLHRLNRQLRAIRKCNEILLRATDEQTLIDEVCRTICEEAGYSMAWVGYVEQDEFKSVRPVAWAGKEDGYLATANITWADTERGRGPTGAAVREGRTVYIQDFAHDVRIAVWREAALNRGYNSSIGLALKDEDAHVFAVVTIYSSERDAFTPDEIRLLEQLAGDLGYGIAALRTRAERKRAEEERSTLAQHLQQAQKLEVVGQLAGGIAHDFNNILTVVNGFSEILLENPKIDEAARSQIVEILNAGNRAASLTRQLLAFSRKQMLQRKILSLNHVIEGMHKMLVRLIGEHIEIKFALGDGLDPVMADPGQMEQVILNFCVNARDAMPDGGAITIATSNVDLDLIQAAQHFPLEPGRYIRLSVSDTGSGMTPATLSHVFEPFFTTKGPDRGTGLGLATVYGIITQSGGQVSAESELGKGATFSVYLPAVMVEATTREREILPPRSVCGTETILLVEDMATLRILIRQLLENRGYKVLEAENGEQALRIAQRLGANISLLVTDVILPKIKGTALARSLRSQYPKINVLFVSGYSGYEVDSGVLEPGVAFLQKPFGAKALVGKVRDLLDGAGVSNHDCENPAA